MVQTGWRERRYRRRRRAKVTEERGRAEERSALVTLEWTAVPKLPPKLPAFSVFRCSTRLAER